ncbi:unnamed protein product, partial [marine sediment metagenome]
PCSNVTDEWVADRRERAFRCALESVYHGN